MFECVLNFAGYPKAVTLKYNKGSGNQKVKPETSEFAENNGKFV